VEKSKIKYKNSVNEDADTHPTVGAFGLDKNGTFSAEYVYSYGKKMKTYKFEEPNPFPGPAISKD